MAEEWSVLIFGDSWADYFVPTWPQVLARRLNAKAIQCAQAGSVCNDLIAQASRCLMRPDVPKAPGGLLKRDTLVVVHTCGNDFIGKMAPLLMGGGNLDSMEMMRPNPGAREAGVILQFLESMYRAGARNFLISGVPIYGHMPIFNIAWPIIANFVNQGRLESLGVSPGDPPQLAMEVQAVALNDRWCEMVDSFSKSHPDAKCIFFDEVGSLDRLRGTIGEAAFDQQMWDMTMFHPSPYGHEQIAAEAHRCVSENWTAVRGLLVHPEVQAASAKATTAPAVAAVSATVAAGYTATAAPAAPMPAATPVQVTPTNSDAPLKVRVRNVKGDITFDVDADGMWKVTELKAAVLAKAPVGFAEAGKVLFLALQGKFLEDGAASITALSVKDGVQVIAVMRPPPAVA